MTTENEELEAQARDLPQDNQHEQELEQAESTESESENAIEEVDHADLLAQEKDKFLRLFAEFENYKKRTGRERMDLFRTAGQEIITALLPVLDDFERALKEIEKQEDNNQLTGVVLIYNKFKETLKSKGLENIAVSSGDAFDPDVHEAITQIPAPDKKLIGKIVDVVEKGYKLGDKIIRHPKVVVGN